MMRKFLVAFFTLALLTSCVGTENINVSIGGSSSSGGDSSAELEIIEFDNISLSADELDAGGVHFVSNRSWLIDIIDISGDGTDWLTFEYTERTAGEHEISITATANSSSEPRTVEAILYVNGIIETTSVISQTGVEAI